MEAENWISLFMALIATASATITYAVYRTATDPEVIVYADVDHKRPSIVNLIIKNIGAGPALDITFTPSMSLPTEAFGITLPENMPKTMTSGPIVNGVPYLAPGQELVLTWGQYGGLKKYMGNSSIVIVTKYCRSRTFRPRPIRIESQSKLDITQFEASDASDHNWGAKLVKTLEQTNKELNNVKIAIQTNGKENS